MSERLSLSLVIDEEYSTVAAHIDDATKEKVILGKYIDFAKLIPQNRVKQEEGHRMEFVMKGKDSYWTPYSERELPTVSNITRWEQAFRVYCDIYTRQYPHKAAELIEYGHVINTTALSYQWDNVYVYDCEFRIHLSKNPNRSWAIICKRLGHCFSKIDC